VKVGLVIAGLAFGCAWALTHYLNPLSFWLSVAAVPVIVVYPLAKRVFPMPQLVLSLAWGFAVLISWSAVVARLDPATWILWGATIVWTLGFDTVYAMSDRLDDQRLGIHSSALFFGRYVPQAVAIFYGCTVLLLAWLGTAMQLQQVFWLTMALSALLWTWQVRQLAQDSLSPTDYSRMFQQNVGMGFLLLGGMIGGCLL
ncbi:MAG TPA: UbiA family prenyltransferase, partial [Candidatus Caenarcaniphilales bacterium]